MDKKGPTKTLYLISNLSPFVKRVYAIEENAIIFGETVGREVSCYIE